MNHTPTQNPKDGWKFVAATDRFFYHKEDGKRLVIGDDGQEPPRYWFAAYRAARKSLSAKGMARPKRRRSLLRRSDP